MIASITDEHRIIIHDLKQFDPYAILHSGQIFRYWERKNGWLIMSKNHWAEIKVEPTQIIIVCDDAKYFYQFFDLKTDYEKIKKRISTPKLTKALECGGGIRILNADFVEMVISFIISANNNIKRFTKTINDICMQFGTLTSIGYHAFPTLEQLELITLDHFKKFGCGYRSEYLLTAVQQLKDYNFVELQKLSNEELQRELLKIKGVGPKVAACIMLFAFHRLDTAPVDTWIKKAITQLSQAEQQTILSGEYAGVAQQYIFYYLQHLHKGILQ